MGIIHTYYCPDLDSSNNEIKKQGMRFGGVTEMPNDDLKWQVRFCKTPGEVEVIAAFKECEDAITFMTAINENLEHGFIVKQNDKVITGFGSAKGNYMMEHNSHSTFLEKTYKTKQDV